ncbi:hypothetical protein MON38_10645 [Hymenobacter sp. DH14]|uniref:Uncharacterized protein n=1 Tax=Hymenobacter cyanobacteriorum TaxID=2926463 RepID=A0A9X1VEU4_9BACT|nr:hypothetical protein [Hymenobacter cyanobacteriorum]MCI1187879.1 hypothetical protein [Hymenobacter cyanobacteriorum]
MTHNEIWLPYGGRLVRLDLSEDSELLPSFAANDRTKPESIENDYAPEFSVPGNQNNHRLLRHAAATGPARGQAYARLPCLLVSDGVETLPIGMLLIKGYEGGQYQLQLTGGNRRLADQLKTELGEDKLLSDLDFSRFDHVWNPANITARLSYDYWAANGYGYEVVERGKPLSLESLDPYTLFPSVSGQLIFKQILADAGFTADELDDEPLFAALNVPTANPYVYPQDFRDARALQAGLIVQAISSGQGNPLEKTAEFPPEKLNFAFTSLAPYRAPTATTYTAGVYTVETLGYYNVNASVLLNYGCDDHFPHSGRVSCKVMLYINGQPVLDANGDQIAYFQPDRIIGYKEETFTPYLGKWLLHPGDTVSLWWQGDEWEHNGQDPTDPRWRVADTGGRLAKAGLPGDLYVYLPATLTVELLEEFPRGGLIKLNQWLPAEMTQLAFLKSIFLLLGITCQTDPYRPHLRLATGDKLLENIPKARNWSSKLDAAAAPGRLPERSLAFRFGDYGKKNALLWTEDEHVTKGYGDGHILVDDEVLPAKYELATLPFAASELSPTVPGVLRILNYELPDLSATTYNSITAKPRLVLRQAMPMQAVQVLNNPDNPAAGKTAVSTTFSFFAGLDPGLLLNGTVLTHYWQDLRAMLDESRYLVERFRLSATDVATLDFSVPVWVAAFNDFFAVSQVVEFDPHRSTEVHLVRLNAKHLPPPSVPGEGVEFWVQEFAGAEFY